MMTPEQARDEIVQMLGEGWRVGVLYRACNYPMSPPISYWVDAWPVGGVYWGKNNLPTVEACIAAVREKYADHIAARQTPPLPDKPPEGFYFLRENGKPVCRVPTQDEIWLNQAGDIACSHSTTGLNSYDYQGRRWILAPERRKAERRRGND